MCFLPFVRIDPEHAKAYFRRALALAALGEYDAARDDLELTAELDPGAQVWDVLRVCQACGSAGTWTDVCGCVLG